MKTIHSNPFQQLHAAESCCQAQYVSPSVSSPHADSCCAHHHADGVSGKWSSLVSGMLLLAGIVMSYIQLSWFQGTIQSVWYLLAFMPVGLPVLKVCQNAHLHYFTYKAPTFTSWGFVIT